MQPLEVQWDPEPADQGRGKNQKRGKDQKSGQDQRCSKEAMQNLFTPRRPKLPMSQDTEGQQDTATPDKSRLIFLSQPEGEMFLSQLDDLSQLDLSQLDVKRLDTVVPDAPELPFVQPGDANSLTSSQLSFSQMLSQGGLSQGSAGSRRRGRARRQPDKLKQQKLAQAMGSKTATSSGAASSSMDAASVLTASQNTTMSDGDYSVMDGTETEKPSQCSVATTRSHVEFSGGAEQHDDTDGAANGAAVKRPRTAGPEGTTQSSSYWQGTFMIRSILVGRQFAPGGSQLLADAQKAVSEGSRDIHLAAERESGSTQRSSQAQEPAPLVFKTSKAADAKVCGTMHQEHARVLLALVDKGLISIVSVEAIAAEVVKLAEDRRRPLPIRLTVEVSCSNREEARGLRRLVASVGASAAATTLRLAPRSKEQLEAALKKKARPAATTGACRSLLANFGRGIIEGGFKGGEELGMLLAQTKFLPDVVQHLNIATVYAARQASSGLRQAVDALEHTRFRVAVESYVNGYGFPKEAADQARELGSVQETGPYIDCPATAAAKWGPGWLPMEEVLDAFETVSPRAGYCHHAQALGLDQDDGWPLVAAGLWAAPGSERPMLARAILGVTGVRLDMLRELLALLVVLSDVCREGHEVVGLRRLHADLLILNRLFEGGGLKVPVMKALQVRGGVKLSDEQVHIVATPLARGETLVVSALAGTGKTLVLRMYALVRPHINILYIGYTNNMLEHARRTFPSNVTCKTVQLLAFHAVGKTYRHKITDDSWAEDLVSCALFDNLVKEDLKDSYARRVDCVENCIATLKSWLSSADPEICENSLTLARPKVILEGVVTERQIVDSARRLWQLMCDESDTDVQMTHPGYIKLYALSRPSLDYDLILVDGAQDVNACQAEIFKAQKCPKLISGDQNQAVYDQGNADKALLATGKSKARTEGWGTIIRRRLTCSYRFGLNIGDVTNYLLRKYVTEARPVLGIHPDDGELLPSAPVDQESFEEEEDMPPMWPRPPFALITRTNSTALDQALKADEAGLTIEWVGGVRSYRLKLFRDYCNLALGRREHVHGDLQGFQSFSSFCEFARRMGSREVLARIDLVNRVGAQELLQGLDRLEADAEKREHAHNPPPPDVSLAAVHKTKGLEWDTVVLADDFTWTVGAPRRTRNLIYVGITRCRRTLQLPGAIYDMYKAEAEAVAAVQPGAVVPISKCPTCGAASQSPQSQATQGDASREPIVLVGSVTLRRLCGYCVRRSPLGPLFVRSLPMDLSSQYTQTQPDPCASAQDPASQSWTQLFATPAPSPGF